MKFKAIEDKGEFMRLWSLRMQLLQLSDVADVCSIISQLNHAMNITASTIKQSKSMIAECFDWSLRQLWLKEIAVKVGDKVMYNAGPLLRPATILKFAEYNPNRAGDVHLQYEDGNKPRTSYVSAYSICPQNGSWNCAAYIKRVRGEQQQLSEETTMTTLPCIVCRKPLEYVWRHVTDEFEEQGKNQPADGVAFYTIGNHGSTVFDSINGRRYLEVNVCDDCLLKAADAGIVATGDTTAKGSDLETWLGPSDADS